MLSFTKSLMRKMLNTIGYDIHKIRLKRSDRFKWLTELDIKTIFDIGANEGQFALEVKRFLPAVNLYSFEPLKDVYEQLLKNTRSLETCYSANIALGDINGQKKIKRSEFSPSSSLLEMNNIHRDNFPYTARTWEEEIEIRRLDDFVSTEHIVIESELLIKLDVQGYEDRVIRGGIDTFRQARVVISEVSFQPLYKGQLVFDELYSILKGIGYFCQGFYEIEYDLKTGIPLFADGIFTKE
jgi:FkbM family methyltransferase